MNTKTGDALESERPHVRVAGRILGIRGFGKANFLVLSDGLRRLQVYVREDSLPALDFRIHQLLDLGDHLGVEGRLFRTKTNELTVWAERLHFLSKCLVPLPEKWHGLTDVETRYRQRYLDLIVNPESRKVFETRAKVVAGVRRFLDSRGFLEVETPMMQPMAGGALARPFVTHHNTLDLDLYLRVAPELYLKRLTVGGLERVYEINRNFRNEGISTQHNPEFTMLEFYEAYVDYEHLMRLTEEMLSTLAKDVTGSFDVPFGEHPLNFAPPYRRLSVREAAAEAASARLGRTVTEAQLRDRDQAARLRPISGSSSGSPRLARASHRRRWTLARSSSRCSRRSAKSTSSSRRSSTTIRPTCRRFRSSAPAIPTRSNASSSTRAASRSPTASAS